jgi:hypothetical protein
MANLEQKKYFSLNFKSAQAENLLQTKYVCYI